MITSLDSETSTFRPGLWAPPLTCVSWADEQLRSGLVHRMDALPYLSRLLTSGEQLVLFNAGWDMCVIAAEFPELFPIIFDVYEAGLIEDVRITQRLYDIARGELGGYTRVYGLGRRRSIRHEYNLSDIHKRWFDEPLEKDEFRLRYGEWRDVPISEWPAGARAYAENDAIATMRIRNHLWSEFSDWYDFSDTYAQARASFALNLITCRGIRTDGPACLRLREEAEREIARCRDLCLEQVVTIQVKKTRTVRKVKEVTYVNEQHTLVEKQRNGAYKRNIAAARAYMAHVCRELGIKRPKKTDGGELSLDAEATRDTDDDVLMAYSTFVSANSLRTKVARMHFGSYGVLQSQYESPINSGRTSSKAPPAPLVGSNTQNENREGLTTDEGNMLPGQRECYIPRPGYALCSVDLDNAEMRALAQVCIWKVGYSRLAEVLNAGRDVHLALAADILHLTYEEAERRFKAGDKAVKQMRQFAKIPNFSLMGAARAGVIAPYAKKQKPAIIIPYDEAEKLYRAYHKAWPEVGAYHDQLRFLCGEDGLIDFECFVSGRMRGGCWLTAAANAGPQSLTGDASKAALLPIARECYVDKRSPLYGSFVVNYVHDETILEVPEERGHEAGSRLAELMVKPWNETYTPDVKMTAKPALMRRWYKGAATVYDSEKRLRCWDPALDA